MAASIQIRATDPQLMFMFFIRSLAITFLALIIISCSSSGEKEQLTEKQYYDQAQKAMDGSRFILAIEKLQQLESRYPFGRYANQAQLEIIYAYYRGLDYGSAVVAAQRFIQLHPDHPELDYAYYMKGLAAYSVDRGLLERFIPSDFSERDMGPARESFEDFSRLIHQFPASKYAEDARERMIYLRNLLAKYEVRVARFYMERQAFIAAANRAQHVIDNFDKTPSIPNALEIQYQAYLELGMKDLANISLEVLKYNYPDYHKLTSEGTLKYDPGTYGRKSVLNAVSFGLID